MKSTLFITTGLLVLAFASQAQEEEKIRKNDIGFSARIFNNPVSPFVIMYKRQVKPALALRVGLGLQANSQKTNYSDNVSNNIQTSSVFSPSVGAEWQKYFAKKWAFYGGADVRGILNFNRSEDFSGTQKTGELVASSKGVTLSPFLGLRFKIFDQLYVATEANLSLSYFETSSTGRNFLNNTSGTTKAFSYSATLQPAVGIFFFYRF